MDIRAGVEAAAKNAANLVAQTAHRLENDPKVRPIIGRLAAATLALSLGAPNFSAEAPNASAEAKVICIEDNQCFTVAAPDEIVDAIARTTTLEAPKNKRPEKAKYVLPEEYHAAERRIDAMELSGEGYLKFLTDLDTSYMYYAARYTAWNPKLFNRHEIKQRQDLPFKFVVNHFTDFYANPGGPGQRPKGKGPEIRRLIRGMNNVDGTPHPDPKKRRPNPHDSCCAFHGFVDRNGKPYLFAPFTSRLAHAGVDNPTSGGIEVESDSQNHITTKQYETLAYFDIYALQSQGVLEVDKIWQLIQGHGARSDKVREDSYRNDFNAPIHNYFLRTKVIPFLRANRGMELVKPDDLLLGVTKTD